MRVREREEGPEAAVIFTETDVCKEWDSRFDWAALAQRCAAAALVQTPHARFADDALSIEISVKLTSDDEVRALNRAYRGKDQATNILSFPMIEAAGIEAAAREGMETLLGDIVLAHDTVYSEAEGRGIAVEDHVAHLLVHGTLHLLGYDHAVDDAGAEEMEDAERRALATLGIADPCLLMQVQA